VKKDLSEYKLEPDLEKECLALEAAESSKEGPALQGLHLVVLGHVDAGKSTLMGRLLHDTGAIGAKEVHKNEREAAQMGKASFSWAWALDERPEERARGVTVDVAMQRFKTSRFKVTLLDAPGHKDFVPNAIAGAAQADAAILLVDGSIGGFEAGFGSIEGHSDHPYSSSGGGGQTKEHAQLARSLGIEQLIVVVSKLDTCGFSRDRFLAIKEILSPYLTKTCGFKV
jgi:elongation factor 1 alpha-like protein